MPPNNDTVRLRHMRDAAEEALGYMKGRSRRDLDSDGILKHAVIYCLLVIGEAANQVTAKGRADYPSLPWSLMVGMRNRLIHAYFDINLDRVWDTITEDLPPLLRELERALAMLQEQGMALGENEPSEEGAG
jgi:uncharacterized protein with HEPN domain